MPGALAVRRLKLLKELAANTARPSNPPHQSLTAQGADDNSLAGVHRTAAILIEALFL